METLQSDTFFLNENIMKTMAWVFTMISGIASIVLTIHKFGLPKWKQISLIGSVLALGLFTVLVIIPKLSGPHIISGQETKHLQALVGELGMFSGGYEKTADGFVSKPLQGEVKRVSEFVYAVMHPNGHFDAVYSGDYFKASLNGTTVNCELIDLGDNRILIIKGTETEFVQLNSSQENCTFKVKRVPIPKQA